MRKTKLFQKLGSTKKYMRQIAIALGMGMALATTTYAQSTVKGKVTDASDKSEMVGVTVAVKGTTVATQTNVSGDYTIEIPNKNAVLTFSFVGKTTQEIPVQNRSIINIGLPDNDDLLEEVVVVAYGTQKKTDLTGSIVAVNSKDFQKGNIQSSEQLLQGKVAGLQVTNGGGTAGGGSMIRIRGSASLNASNDPLIVIDGIPVEGNEVKGSKNVLNTINPNDIENISVLKDASATALYGSRASNGVIIITTKKGASGRPTFNFNTLFSAGAIAKKIAVLNGDQVRELITADAASTGDDTYKKLLGTQNTDWQDQIFKTAIGFDNNLSAGGTYKNIPFRVSVGYSDQNGILKTNHFQRTSGALNLNPKLLNKALTVNLNLKMTQTDNRAADEEAIRAALSMDPTQPIYAQNNYGGYFEWIDDNNIYHALAGHNPLGLLELRNNTSTVNRLLGNVELDYALPFLEGMHVKSNLGLDHTKSKGSDIISSLSSTNYLTEGRSTEIKQEKSNKLWDISLFYEKELLALKSKIDILALHSYQAFETTDYFFPSYNENGETIIPGTEPLFATDRPEFRLESYLGRINYMLMDKYLATFSIRRDASSKFSPDNRAGYFPALALAWKMKKDLFKNTAAVSDMKLRFGWGTTGQQDFKQNYPYLARYGVSTNTAQYQFGNIFNLFYRPAAFDPNITWESTTTTNLGLDYGLFDNRITGTIELFQKKTKNLLSDIPVAYGSTFDINLFTNVGKLENKGLEIVLNTTPILKDKIRLDVGANFTISRIEIKTLRKQQDPNFIGIPVSGITGGTGNKIGLHALGNWPYTYYVFQQVYNENGIPLEGVYVDRNTDGLINDEDRYLLKKPAPNSLFGLSASLTYHKFTVSTSGHAMFGNYLYNNYKSNSSVFRNLRSNVQIIHNASKDYYEAQFYNNQYLSDYYIENASFFRLDNINLGYYVGKVFGDVTMSVNAGVNNVFVISKYSGLDPENSKPEGTDNVIYPRPRVFTMGLNFDF